MVSQPYCLFDFGDKTRGFPTRLSVRVSSPEILYLIFRVFSFQIQSTPISRFTFIHYCPADNMHRQILGYLEKLPFPSIAALDSNSNFSRHPLGISDQVSLKINYNNLYQFELLLSIFFATNCNEFSIASPTLETGRIIHLFCIIQKVQT